jgi:hypothetical protein
MRNKFAQLSIAVSFVIPYSGGHIKANFEDFTLSTILAEKSLKRA